MPNIFPFFTVVFITLLVIGLLYFFAINKVINLLKNNHPLKYEKLGKPSLFLNNSIQNGLNLVRFIFTSDDLNDVELTKYKTVARYTLIANLLIFLPFFVYINVRVLFKI